MADGPLPADYGTKELQRRHQMTAVVTEHAGIFAAKVEDECLLDRIYLAGHLRDPQDRDNDLAARRRDAGLWFKEQWQQAGLEPRQIGNYSHGRGQTTEVAEQMSEDQAYAWRRVSGALRAMRPFGALPHAICITDFWPQWGRWGTLRKMLDALASYREAHS